MFALKSLFFSFGKQFSLQVEFAKNDCLSYWKPFPMTSDHCFSFHSDPTSVSHMLAEEKDTDALRRP